MNHIIYIFSKFQVFHNFTLNNFYILFYILFTYIKLFKLLLKKQKKDDFMVIKNIDIINKENAYYLDFQFNRHYLAKLIHNVKVDYKDTSALCDHILITPKGVTILKILSFEGILTINKNNSLRVNYGKYYKTLPNPLKQNEDNVKIVKDYLNSNLKFQFIKDIKVDSQVIVDSKTHTTNHPLPNGFKRDTEYIKDKIIEIEQSSVVEGFSQMQKLLNEEQREAIVNLFLNDNISLNIQATNKDLKPISTYSKII